MDTTLPLLTLLILVPPVGAAMMTLVSRLETVRRTALLIVIADLLVALLVAVGFDPGYPGFQWVEQRNWIPTLHITYMVGVDGLSLLFLPLTVLLFAGIIIASWNSVRLM